MRILLVDNDKFDRMIMRHLISRQSRLSASITELTTLDEASSILHEQHFHIVILSSDLSPHCNVETLLKLRNIHQDTSTAFLIVCNVCDDIVALKCLKAGAEDYLLKTDISTIRLHNAVLHAQIRFELEQQSYVTQQVEIREASIGTQSIEKSARFAFNRALKARLSSSHKKQLALFLMDLDNFKYVNDAYGHDIGDKILRKVALRLRRDLKKDDLVTRFGGDEFAILVEQLDIAEKAPMVAKRLLETVGSPMSISGISIQLSASIGIAMNPSNGTNQNELIKHADIAMYQAKASGNKFCFFEEKMEQGITQRMFIDSALREIKLAEELVLNFQPVINPLTSDILGFEALLRWSKEGNIYMPDDFIFIAEENGQILDIGRWVIESSLSHLARWNKSTNKAYTMAINISPVQLADPLLIDCLVENIKVNQLDPSLVEVELTETALLGKSTQLLEIIIEIHNLGCRISLDDFGTGYSSISHLQSYPIDTIKLDKSIMPLSVQDRKNQALIHGLTIMANILGICVIAEGVESKEQADACLLLGICKVQGYFYHKPLSIEDIEKLIASAGRIE